MPNKVFTNTSFEPVNQADFGLYSSLGASGIIKQGFAMGLMSFGFLVGDYYLQCNTNPVTGYSACAQPVTGYSAIASVSTGWTLGAIPNFNP